VPIALKINLEDFLKIGTFFIFVFLVIICSWAAEWHLGPTMVSLVLVLVGFVVIVTLPIKRFKLGPQGFEGELENLARSPTPKISEEQKKETEQQVRSFSDNSAEPDLVLMRLSIEIESTLRQIAENLGMKQSKVGIGQLIRFLKREEALTDNWLINALQFFQKHRNELVHEGRTSDIEKAIEIGQSVLAYLRDLQKSATSAHANL
jgi:hypothetical protein